MSQKRLRVSKSIFFSARHKRLARVIRIDSPSNFRRSIAVLKKNGISLLEFRALVLAKNRAKAILRKSGLSVMERRQMRAIVNTPIPKPKRK